MPRKPRLDAPGFVYHIIVRGIERRQIFSDDKDREFLLSRLGAIIKETETPAYAFALIPNHFHLLLRRGATPIPTIMRRLLTGYAVYFNKRHNRVGHLFQNRYKGIICQDDPYLLELIRYIHLNPVRAGIIESIKELSSCYFSGHSYILGNFKNAWFNPEIVLNQFAKTENKAKKLYLKFVSAGLSVEKINYSGVNKQINIGKNNSHEKQILDDRILGQDSFIEKLLALSEIQSKPAQNDNIGSLMNAVCSKYDVTEAELFSKTKRRKTAEARAVLVFKMAKESGLSGSQISEKLLITSSAISKMIRKGNGLAGDL